METRPKFVQGIFGFTGKGMDMSALPGSAPSYTVPADRRTQLIYFRAGNSCAELVVVTLMRDGKPMRLFPIGAKSSVHVSLAVVEDLMPDTRIGRHAGGTQRHVRRSGARYRPSGNLIAAQGSGAMKKQTLVVIGNGMAGARAVEEVLARGGAEQFEHRHVRRRTLRQLQPHHALERAQRRAGVGRDLHQPARLVRRERHHAACRHAHHRHRPRRPRGGHRQGSAPPV